MKYFYDCGANIGQTFEWFLLKGDYRDHHVVCFEPSPRHLSALMQTANLMRDHFAGITVVPIALSSDAGLLQFFEKDSLLADSLHEGWHRNRSTGINLEVAAMSLAVYLQDHTTPDDSVVVKLDIEGAEWGVLEDLLRSGQWRQEVQRRITEIHVEWHDADGYTQADVPHFVRAFASIGIPLKVWPF